MDYNPVPGVLVFVALLLIMSLAFGVYSDKIESFKAEMQQFPDNSIVYVKGFDKKFKVRDFMCTGTEVEDCFYILYSEELEGTSVDYSEVYQK